VQDSAKYIKMHVLTLMLRLKRLNREGGGEGGGRQESLYWKISSK